MASDREMVGERVLTMCILISHFMNVFTLYLQCHPFNFDKALTNVPNEVHNAQVGLVSPSVPATDVLLLSPQKG